MQLVSSQYVESSTIVVCKDFAEAEVRRKILILARKGEHLCHPCPNVSSDFLLPNYLDCLQSSTNKQLPFFSVSVHYFWPLAWNLWQGLFVHISSLCARVMLKMWQIAYLSEAGSFFWTTNNQIGLDSNKHKALQFWTIDRIFTSPFSDCRKDLYFKKGKLQGYNLPFIFCTCCFLVLCCHSLYFFCACAGLLDSSPLLPNLSPFWGKQQE